MTPRWRACRRRPRREPGFPLPDRRRRRPFALIWSIAVNFANFSANLWLTRKVCGVLGVATLPAYMGLGAALGVGAAWLSCVSGMGDSNIGYAMEALAGAGVAGLYRLLSGSVSR